MPCENGIKLQEWVFKMTDDKVPKKLYMIRTDIGIKSAMFMLTSDRLDDTDLEYTLTSSVYKRLEAARKLHEKWKDKDHICLDYHNESWQVLKNLVED